MPGDVLKIEILSLSPRPNPEGKTFGINAAAWWGYQFRTGWKTGASNREVTTVYEVKKDATGKPTWAEPVMSFLYGNGINDNSTCVPPNGTYPDTVGNLTWDNSGYGYAPGKTVPCVNGKQSWSGYQYPGLITSHPQGSESTAIAGKFRVPLNFHIGNIGVAPPSDVPVNSIPPLFTGGNMDNRRIGAGATLYLKCAAPGCLLHMGDAHSSQGDSEFDGTGIETHVNGKFRVTVIKAATAPLMLANLSFPLIENAENYIVQGFAYNGNYLEAPDLQGGGGAANNIFGAGTSIDKAFVGAYTMARDWLMAWKGLTEDEAISFITVMCDFQVTQVVDGNFGVHVVVPKYAFATGNTLYSPTVACGTSTKTKCVFYPPAPLG